VLTAICSAGAAADPGQTDLYADRLPPGAIAGMGTVRFRHSLPIMAVQFSPLL
jgi:hypothetical protein